jgi:diguanylate cyclase (GGDEF)-like protein
MAVGVLAIAGTLLASYRSVPVVEEIVAQLLILMVLVGALQWGRKGGFISAVLATGIYILLRVPLLAADGVTSELIQMIGVRTLAYGVIGILGGEVCSRIKYFFARMEDSGTIDAVTRIYNQRYISRTLAQTVGKHERYGEPFSVVLFTISPALLQPLRKARQRSVLRSIASFVRNDIRLVDDVGRLDDGRFVVLLPHTPKDGAEVAAERLKRGLRDLLTARDESVSAQVMGAPEDLQHLSHLAEALKVADPPGAAQAVSPS